MATSFSAENESQPINGQYTFDNKPEIATFVFMDFESTSLLSGRQQPRIVELCLIAVHRTDVTPQGSMPRILNKLSLCLDPGKPMSFGASEITGLYNDSLEQQKCLSDKTIMLINGFLDHLAKPVCLLSHNGNGFDFPLLNAELKRIKQSLSGDILCADTLEAFRSLDGLPARFHPLTNQNGRITKNDSTPKSTQSCWSRHPSVKRKSSQDENSEITNTCTKVVKHNIDKFDVTLPAVNNADMKRDADKVKKKLFVDDAGSGTNLVKDNNKQKPSVQDQTNEFSESLEVEDYFQALEDTENQLMKNNSNKLETKQPSESTDKQTSEMKSLNMVDKTGQEMLKKTAVESCTGYFIRNKTNTETKQTKEYQTALNNGAENYTTPGIALEEEQPYAGETSTSSSASFHVLTSAASNNHPSQSSSSSTFSNSPPLQLSSSSELSFSKLLPSSSSSLTQSPASLQSPLSSSDSGSNQLPASSTSITNCATPNKPTGLWSVGLPQPVQRQSYKLEQIYLRKFGSLPEKTHNAEGDCVAMLKIACCTPGLINWIDQHAVKLSTVEPGY